MIHPSKRVQGCKEDRRFVYKETFLDLNEWSYYRIEKEEDRLKWVICYQAGGGGIWGNSCKFSKFSGEAKKVQGGNERDR